MPAPVGENTVNHVRNILGKLRLHSRMEAVMYAVRETLLDISQERPRQCPGSGHRGHMSQDTVD